MRRLGNLYEVVNGNHRYDALVVLRSPTAICFDLGEISEEEAVRIAIETNETRFRTDSQKLAELLRGLAVDTSLEDLADTIPFSREEMTALIGSLDIQWDKKDQDERKSDQSATDNGSAGDTDGDHNDESPAGESPGERFTKHLSLDLPEETYNVWLKWVDRYSSATGCADPDIIDSRALEAALVEATNTPREFFHLEEVEDE